MANERSDSLNKQFRRAARLLHPDLTLNGEEKARRHRLMAEVNDAYARGDENTIRTIIRDWLASPNSVQDGPTDPTGRAASSAVPWPPQSRYDRGYPDVVSGSAAMINGVVLQGLKALIVEVEIGLNRSRFDFVISGLGRREVKESRHRLENALPAVGYDWPDGAVTVNLAPADVPKGGTSLDLAIALALLEASGQFVPRLAGPVFVIGQLGLDGRVRSVDGALTMATQLPDRCVLIAPADNNDELALLRLIEGAKKEYTPYVVHNLREAVEVLKGRLRPIATTRSEKLKPAVRRGVDFSEVIGQERAKRGLEVAAAGGHNVLLIGPPGEGKTLLAKALPTILPKLSPPEIIELTSIYSAAGKLPDRNSVVTRRPYCAVHHTVSRQALVGGGIGVPRPGEITLAHRGVLFLDEIPEFGRSLLETLRQPLEDGFINLQRTGGAATFPCEVILVAAMNPCPCARDGEVMCKRCERRLGLDQKECPKCGSRESLHFLCACSERDKRAYRARLSGPIMDRIDLKIRVGSLSAEERFAKPAGETSESIRQRVQAARDMQLRRFHGTDIGVNARIPGGRVRQYCELHASAEAAMREVAAKAPELTTRGHDKLLKTARTVADLNSSQVIYKKHVIEAAGLCGHEDVREFLMSMEEKVVCPSCREAVEPHHRFCPNCGSHLRGVASAVPGTAT